MSDTLNQDKPETTWDPSNPEDLLRILFEEAADGVFIADPQGRFMAVNPRGTELTGYPREELLGLTVTDLIPPEDLSREPLRLDELRPGKTVVQERRFRRKDGGLLPVEVSVRMLPEGNLLGLVRDITERQQAEKAIRRNEELLRSLIDSAPFGAHVYELNEQDRLVFSGYNQSANRILGVDNEQFLGQTIEEAFPPLAETEIPARYKRAAAAGEGFAIEQVDYLHGKIRGAFEVHAFQIAPRRMAAFFVDITERKRAEARAAPERGAFAPGTRSRRAGTLRPERADRGDQGQSGICHHAGLRPGGVP